MGASKKDSSWSKTAWSIFESFAKSSSNYFNLALLEPESKFVQPLLPQHFLLLCIFVQEINVSPKNLEKKTRSFWGTDWRVIF